MLMKRKDVSDGYHDNENNLKKFKQAKDPKTVRVKQECFSHDGSNSFKHTGLKQVMHELITPVPILPIPFCLRIISSITSPFTHLNMFVM